MIIVILSKCPKSLRGDLSKWMVEVSTNVFVGSASAKIRDNLWERIRSSVKGGKALMVYNTNSVQGFEFREFNEDYDIIELDRIKLIRIPNKEQTD